MTDRPVYHKRFRMERPLDRALPPARPPAGVYWQPWRDDLLDLFAQVKHACFRGELDAEVFPNFASPAGCRELMRAIRGQPGFCRPATWLAVGPDGCAGTVQGVCQPGRWGAVQNVGVLPGWRGAGLGRALVLRALHGFRAAGMRAAYLEVTARNEHAVRLYRSLGFRCTRTHYKLVQAAAAEVAV
jgi:ribosomal protein S18 acetylase RimI-like enzyme